MEDPEFPGEAEFLYFVLIEFNIEDIKEYKRITALEMTGTLDPDGVKAFVEVTQLNWDSTSPQIVSITHRLLGCLFRSLDWSYTKSIQKCH